EGNVLSTCAVGTPGLNGVYLFGSHVSVCAIPPAIHRTITASAVAGGAVAARTSSGSPPISAASDPAAVVPMNPRRLIRELMYFSSLVIAAFLNRSTETRASSKQPITNRPALQPKPDPDARHRTGPIAPRHALSPKARAPERNGTRDR